ncbi:MAG: imidazoleglycerol-phosphate dehydratase, partial [Fibrobacter sp.]|nr:imidazoleglycerol-phosphate dehydratase [Fibrobacter sp.]
MRSSKISRKTSETDIQLFLNLDDASRGKINSGSGFLDHMLNLFQVHGGFHLDLDCKGDTEVDMHHSMEDIAIVLGQALVECLGDKKGIERYGFYFVPMDEALSRVCIDFSNRIGFVW